MELNLAGKTFKSFNRKESANGFLQMPDKYREISLKFERPYIPRGAGLSYTGASFGENCVSQQMTSFNRLLSVDSESSVVCVESGLAIGDLVEWGIHNNLYFPVLPGHPSITVGGCVAADVHGKNPWKDGTFSDHVLGLTICIPGVGIREVGINSQEDVFRATCGGYGLTGTVLKIKLQAYPLPSKFFKETIHQVSTFQQAIEMMREKADLVPYIYSWHDGGARGKFFGRGLVFYGEWTSSHESFTAKGQLGSRRNFLDKIELPIGIWNAFTIRLINSVFFRVSKFRPSKIKSVLDAIFPFSKNRLYHLFFGKRGFHELQFLFGFEEVFQFLEEYESLLEVWHPNVTMCSLKLFKGKQASLSMNGEGCLFAINFTRNRHSKSFSDAIYQLASKHGGQINLSKDSNIPEKLVPDVIKNFNSFKSAINKYPESNWIQSKLKVDIDL